MCNNPPPPPPMLIALDKKGIAPSNKIDNITTKSHLCIWASQYPELQEACRKNNICVNEKPYKYEYTHFQSILQEGPTCGLVAISMMINRQLSANDILEIAKTESYTENGEMFSCKNMMKLTETVINLCKIDVRIELRKGELSSLSIISSLLNKCLLFVPYDSDFNHAPCLKKGHKAHWALVCGIIIPQETLEEVYLLCKHGKSLHLAIWNIRALEASNGNLYEFSPKRDEDALSYVLPRGGLAGDDGLCGQFVLVEGL